MPNLNQLLRMQQPQSQPAAPAALPSGNPAAGASQQGLAPQMAGNGQIDSALAQSLMHAFGGQQQQAAPQSNVVMDNDPQAKAKAVMAAKQAEIARLHPEWLANK